MSSGAPGGNERLSIIDVGNKFKAMQTSLPVKPVRAVVDEWGSLYLLSKQNTSSNANDHLLYQLTEKDIQTKLEILFKMNCYDLAIRVSLAFIQKIRNCFRLSNKNLS